MRLDTSMSQQMSQKMILAPRMIQSMESLQLPIMAMQERIQQELQENPVLELREASSDEPAAGEEETEGITEPPNGKEADVTDPERELVIDEKGNNEEDFDRFEAMAQEWADHFSEEHRPSSNRLEDEGDKKHDAMQNMAARPQSLQDYLAQQLPFLDATAPQLRLIRYLLTHVDEKGYLTAHPEETGNGHDQLRSPEELE